MPLHVNSKGMAFFFICVSTYEFTCLVHRNVLPKKIRIVGTDLNRLNLCYETNRNPARSLFPDAMVQASVDLNLDLVTFFDKELSKVK